MCRASKASPGASELPAFLGQCDILVCVLPLTPETRGIMNAALFAQLPQGAWVINVARGAHLIEEDLIAALDSGHLAGAVLDVFQTEPLPADSPIWRHPKITATPHIAGIHRSAQRRWPMSRTAFARAEAGETACRIVVDVDARLLKPFDRRDRPGDLFDARDRLGQRFGRHLHVKGVGVQQMRGVEHHAHMAFPEHQIAALQIGMRRQLSPKAFSCMSVSRGQAMPAACSAVWIRPEQSSPAKVLPPQT